MHKHAEVEFGIMISLFVPSVKKGNLKSAL